MSERPAKRSRWESAEDEQQREEAKASLKARLEREKAASAASSPRTPVRRAAASGIVGSRSVYSFERLNHIEEGSYGVVSRARDKETGEIVALKKLKMDQEKNGFPITSLREIKTLMTVSNHDNIVQCKEIVVGDTLTQCVAGPVRRHDARRIFLVFEFVEHDLKTLLANMRTPFLASEVKTLMLQLLSAIGYCHDNWIIHRDLKTSNLLMNNRGQIKVADFGLARKFGDPQGEMTQLVVTLWYR